MNIRVIIKEALKILVKNKVSFLKRNIVTVKYNIAIKQQNSFGSNDFKSLNFDIIFFKKLLHNYSFV